MGKPMKKERFCNELGAQAPASFTASSTPFGVSNCTWPYCPFFNRLVCKRIMAIGPHLQLQSDAGQRTPVQDAKPNTRLKKNSCEADQIDKRDDTKFDLP